MSINIHHGSILDVQADVVTNAANSFLLHGGGLARFLADNAAPFSSDAQSRESAAWRQEQKDHPNIPTGGVGWTSAGALPFKIMAHAVGPIWGGGGYLEMDLMEIVHDRLFRQTLDGGYTSVVVPAISCGIFGFPVHLAARVALDVAEWYADRLDITFALTDEEHTNHYAKARSCL